MNRTTELLAKAMPDMVLASLLLLIGCGASQSKTVLPSANRDDTDYVQALVDAGSTVPAGTYVLRRTIVIRNSGTVVQGVGSDTVFIFQPNLPPQECWNDRAFTTSCDSFYNPNTRTYVNRRRISAPITIGDTSFQAVDDVSDLQPGDWLVITERDAIIRDVVTVDWVQVASAAGNTVTVRDPFRTAFPNTNSWDPIFSGLGFFKVVNPVQNVQFRNFSLMVPDAGQNMAGLSIFNAQHVVVEDVAVKNENGQALYSYISQDVTFRNCSADSGPVLSEFAATTDLIVIGNAFSSRGDSGMGLDLGSGFFAVSNNSVINSHNIGLYLLYGVHDGTVQNNSISFVTADNNAVGILARGTQNVNITDNGLAGGQGQQSIGLSIGPAYQSEVPISSFGNIVSPNAFGSWFLNYDPTNQP